jgi:uncharacterized protein YjiS (DUF1127 family)
MFFHGVPPGTGRQFTRSDPILGPVGPGRGKRNSDKEIGPKFGFQPAVSVNNQLLKLCAFCIAAAQHYCFSFGRIRLFSRCVESPATRRLEEQRKKTAMFASIVRMIRSWNSYNRSLNELSRLGDRELADIGISRSDIVRVAWNNAQHR